MSKNLLCKDSRLIVNAVLSNSAEDILDRVLAELQNAEEMMGGVKDLADYILLMTVIVKEATQRISNAAEQLPK